MDELGGRDEVEDGEMLQSMHGDENTAKSKSSGIRGLETVLMNPDKILLPVKEYSNKFLRDKKAKAQLEVNHSILKQKKSFVYVRK